MGPESGLARFPVGLWCGALYVSGEGMGAAMGGPKSGHPLNGTCGKALHLHSPALAYGAHLHLRYTELTVI